MKTTKKKPQKKLQKKKPVSFIVKDNERIIGFGNNNATKEECMAFVVILKQQYEPSRKEDIRQVDDLGFRIVVDGKVVHDYRIIKK